VSEEAAEVSTEAVEATPSTEAAEATQVSGWLDSVDTEFRSDPNVSKHENINSLVREHIGAQSMLGRKGIIAPKEGDSEDVHRNYREALGVPSAASEYSAEGVNLGEDWDHEFGAKVASVAHKHNVSKEGFKAIVKEYADWANGISSNSVAESERLTAERLESLKTELGTNFEATKGLGQAALSNLANDASAVANIQLSDGTLLGNHPDFIRVMGKAGKLMAEKGMIGDKPVNPHGMTPEEATTALGAFEADKDKFEALYNADHPGHSVAVAEYDRLLSFAHPEQ